MKKCIAVIVLLLTVFGTLCGNNRINTLTYAVYPYIPDAEYYQEIIERRWAEIEPDIKLVRAEWDCYYDGMPDGIDVIMYDAVMRDELIESGWTQPIDPRAVQKAEDIFPFALEGLTVDGKLYGVPVFLCGNFLIYDMGCTDLAEAEHLTDFWDKSELLVINSESVNRPQYIYEVLADTLGEANPAAVEDSDGLMALIDRLAVDAFKRDDDTQVALAYDSGNGKGYIGFSESLRLLSKRISQTRIKSISFSDREDVARLYVDAVAVSSKAKGPRFEKCIELVNIIAEADVLSTLSVQDGAAQYLLLAQKTPYQTLRESFPLYTELEKLASNDNNRVILGPRP